MILAGQNFFWAGVGLCILAWLFFIVDWFRVSRGMPNITKFFGTLVPNILLILVIWIAIRPAPLEISFDAPNMDYSEGSDLHGIKWISQYSELRITLANRTDNEYDNVDVFISTNISIAQIVTVGDHINCVNAPNLRYDMVAFGTDASGKKAVVPGTTS